MPKLKDKPKDESFEKLYSELKDTITKLETGDLPLDESLTLFQRGMELSKHCGALLDQAELRIKELVPHGDQVAAEDFDDDEK